MFGMWPGDCIPRSLGIHNECSFRFSFKKFIFLKIIEIFRWCLWIFFPLVPWWRGLHCYLFCLILFLFLLKTSNLQVWQLQERKFLLLHGTFLDSLVVTAAANGPPLTPYPYHMAFLLFRCSCLAFYFGLFDLTIDVYTCRLLVSSCVATCVYRKHRNLSHLPTDCCGSITSVARDHHEIAINCLPFSERISFYLSFIQVLIATVRQIMRRSNTRI